MEEFTDESVYPPVRKFRCQVCLKCFGQKHHCKRHVGEAHFLSEKVECQNCGKFFKNKRCAQEHFRYCNAQMIWSFRWVTIFTSVSVFMFLDPGEFVEPFTDQSVYPAVEKFRCRACGKSFGRIDNCKRHIKSAHLEVDQVACSKCGKYYKNQRSARDHYRVCVNLWKCRLYCTLVHLDVNSFHWNINALNDILMSLSDPGDFVEAFTDHSVYPPMEKFRCRACGRSFNEKGNCRRHAKSAHYLEERVACQNCGKYYKNKRTAQEHFRNCIKNLKPSDF